MTSTYRTRRKSRSPPPRRREWERSRSRTRTPPSRWNEPNEQKNFSANDNNNGPSNVNRNETLNGDKSHPSGVLNQLGGIPRIQPPSRPQRDSRNFNSRQYPDYSSKRRGDDYDSKRSKRPYDSGDSRDRNTSRSKRYDDDPNSKFKDAITAPRGGYYFEHDNRFDDTSFDDRPSRRLSSDRRRSDGRRSPKRHDVVGWRNADTFGQRMEFSSFVNEAARNYSKSSYNSSRRDSGRTDGFWRHDKFEELERDEKDDGRRRRRSRSSS